jgi:hypothetical protein
VHLRFEKIGCLAATLEAAKATAVTATVVEAEAAS